MRPYVLTIAGHDPSGGAGLNADTKTFEQLKVQGLSVCTALTIQNDNSFKASNWVNDQTVIQQVDILLDFYKPKVAKIGIIQSKELLEKLLTKLQQHEIKIVWDPILKSSTGFSFHQISNFDNLLKNIDIITPNCPEAKQLFGTDDSKTLMQLCIEKKWSPILLKGGHSKKHKGDDLLISSNEIILIKGKNQHLLSDKHGTGCILSSAIAANLAKNMNLKEACSAAKRYVERAMLSNKTLLSYHA